MALTPRVLIQGGATNAVSVSAPTKDVTTALLNEMQFDSRWAQLELFMKGSFFVAGSGTGPETTGFLSFGTTLSDIPLIAAYAQQSPNAFGWGLTIFRGNSADYWWAAEVGTTGVTFRNFAFGASLTFYYVIFRRPSG